MRVKSALSSLALVAGLLVSGSAFGQSMINGVAIPKANWPPSRNAAMR